MVFALVILTFGCEEKYDKSGIYTVDIVTMNKTDSYAVVDYRTLCGVGRLYGQEEGRLFQADRTRANMGD